MDVPSLAMSWSNNIGTPSPRLTITNVCRRMAIVAYFLEEMDAPPAIEDSKTTA